MSADDIGRGGETSGFSLALTQKERIAMSNVRRPSAGSPRAGFSQFNLPALLGAALLFANSQAHSGSATNSPAAAFSSIPKDRTSYWRQTIPDDFTLGRPAVGASAVSLFLCDVVVSNTDRTLNTTDTWGDEEPSIAVNPSNPNEIVILSFSGFWGATTPLWHSTDGGLSWTKSFTVPAPTGLSISGPGDQAPDYGRNNQLSMVFLGSDNTSFSSDCYAGITTDPSRTTAFNWPLVGGVAVPADQVPGFNDQPWILVNPDPFNPSLDNTYVAYDDFFGSPDMRVVVSRGANPPVFANDNLVGFSTGFVNPGQRLAKDPTRGYIYSLWQAWVTNGAGGSKNLNFMLNRSIDGGATWTLNGSSTGIVVGNGDSTQPTPKFGTVNALLGGVDHAAVDPGSGDVYYVHAKRDPATSNNRLVCQRLTANGTGGLNIGPEVFVTAQVQAALPSVAVTTNGFVGVLYDTFDGFSSSGFPTFAAHLAVSTDQGASFTNSVLYSFVSSAKDSGDSRQRVLGDYQQMKAVGLTFYGVFTANGVGLGRPIANHDPIFFKATVASAPVIDTQPTSQTTFQGDGASFVVGASGFGTLSYQWQFNGSPLAGATDSTLVLPNVALSQAGAYSVVVSNLYGSTPSSTATLTVIPTVSLPFALNTTNAPSIVWLTNGNAGWHGLTNISHDGVAAGQSGPIGDSQASILTTTVTGPGTLSFWWKVSSQANADFLTFVAAGTGYTNTAQISGEVDWQQARVLLPAGPVTLQWTYAKDASAARGSDAGWVDQVSYTAGATLPIIVQQPVSQGVFAATPVSFNVVADGTPVLGYQWRLNGTDIPGATSNSLALPNPGITDAGLYSVRVSNAYGTTNSASASLGVVPLAVRGDNTLNQINLSLLATNAISIAAGSWHSLILRSDDSLLAFGDDSDGQIDLPANLNNVLAIAAGGYHSLALNFDGTVTAWGNNFYGQTTIPPGLSNVTAVAAGTWHSLALRANGTVLAWGLDTSDQIAVPQGLANVVAIAAAGNHSLALCSNGTVVAWGDNYDALGDFAGQSFIPFDLTNVVAIGAGDYHSLAIKADGSVVAWGSDSDGQCDVPANLTNAVAIVGGNSHTIALKADSTIAAFGNDWNGQCDFPPGVSNVVAMAAGYSHTILLQGNRFAPPRLVRPVRHAGRFSVAVLTLSGKNYTLEYKNSLSVSAWTGIVTVRGNGAQQLLTDPAALGPQRFYRVRQW